MKKIINVEVLEDYQLLLTFDNNEIRIKDMKPYLDKGVFTKLKDKSFFNNVRISFGTITWDEEIEICADSLYKTSKKVN